MPYTTSLQIILLTGSDPEHSWKDAKFTTKCWFLTLFAHHVGLIPAQQRYVKEISKEY